MTVELRDLRWALVASQHKSLRQAASTLCVRQSTLSRRLRAIEQYLGAELFERTNGGTRPTIVGQDFLDAVSRIVGEMDRVVARVKTQSRGESGRLVIGVCASLSIGNLHATLADHRRRFRDVEIHIVDGTSDDLLTELASNTIDVAIISGTPERWHEQRLPLWSERVVIALPKGHSCGESPVVYWSQLVTERLLVSRQGPGPDLETLLEFKLHCFGPTRIMHQDAGLDRLLSLVSTGYGVTLLLEGGTGLHFDGVIYRELHDDAGSTRLAFHACWKGTNSNPTLDPFLKMLRERYPDLSGEPQKLDATR